MPDRRAGAHVDAEARQVAGERVPQGGGERLGGDVEEQPLAGAEEVDVEHQDQLGGGQLARVGEEAAGEDLEGQVVGGLGKADAGEEVVGADAVEPLVDLGHPHVQQRQGGPGVHPRQIADAEGRAQRDEAESAQRRGARDAGEAVVEPGAVPQRVVGQRGERLQTRVDPAQQAAQVVVLAEEGVEAAAHRHGRAVGEPRRPSRQPSAQIPLALVEGDPYAPLGQPGGGRDPGEAAADDRGGGGVAGEPGAAQ